MNWLYITVMGYIVVSALRGFHKGFLRVIYSVVALAVTVLFVTLTAPLLRDALLQSTTIKQQIEAGSGKYVRVQVDRKLEDGSWTELVDLPWLALPKPLQEELNHAAKASLPDLLESQGIYQKMAESIADFCVWLIAFFIALAVISLILFVIGRKLDLFSRKPGIHLVNMVFGFFAGVAKAFLVIWVVFLLIRATQILPASAALVEMIEENAVLRGLYEQNWVLELVQNLDVMQQFR